MNTKKQPRGRPNKDVTLDKKQEIRCHQDDKSLWQDAAYAKGYRSVSEWARSVLTNSAKRAVKDD